MSGLRRMAALFGGTALVTTVIVGVGTSAYADAVVTDYPALQAAFSDANAVGNSATLGADVSAPGSTLALGAGQTLTLNLTTHTLDVSSVVLGSGSALTITAPDASGTLNAQIDGIRTAGASLTIAGGSINANSTTNGAGIGGAAASPDNGSITISDGVVTAHAGGFGAGIGGGGLSGPAIVIISGGTVNATTSSWGAGIGSGGEATATSTVTISGGTVTASSGTFGAGIGGGAQVDGGIVTISGGIVAATGSPFGAGIGGGSFAGGGTVSLEGGEITAINGASAASAVGNSDPADGFGSLEIAAAATLRIPAGATLAVPAGVTIPGAGALRGTGAVTNAGAIQLPTANVDWGALGVLPHNFLVTFDANFAGAPASQDVRVFASSFASGARTDPPEPVRTGFVFTGWHTTQTGGILFTPNTVITTDLPLYAHWIEAAPTPGLAPTGTTGTTALMRFALFAIIFGLLLLTRRH